MTAGMMRHRVTIQELSGSATSNGDYSQRTWSDVGEAWASIQFSKGSESENDRESSDNYAKIKMRYRTDVSTKMRILNGSEIYEVVHTHDMDGKKRYLIIEGLRRDI
jgi:SPP1 family predicted phage head-tail adaptor